MFVRPKLCHCHTENISAFTEILRDGKIETWFECTVLKLAIRTQAVEILSNHHVLVLLKSNETH